LWCPYGMWSRAASGRREDMNECGRVSVFAITALTSSSSPLSSSPLSGSPQCELAAEQALAGAPLLGVERRRLGQRPPVTLGEGAQRGVPLVGFSLPGQVPHGYEKTMRPEHPGESRAVA